MDRITPQYALKPRRWYKRWWGVMLLTILAFFLILAFAIAFETLDLMLQLRSGKLTYADLTGEQTNQNGLSPLELTSGNQPYLGNPDAKITIVEFADFKCPYSQQAYPIMQRLINNNKDKIKFIFRDFPITSEDSLLAAEAANCAFEQSNFAFWAMHDRLFTDQNSITTEGVQKVSSDLGLDTARFGNCLNTKKYDGEISKDLSLGQKFGAKKTPTFFINGEKIEGVWPIENWQKAIDYLLAPVK